MRVVVTGATGNVGTAVLRALGGDPAVDTVLGLARRLPDHRPAKVEWAEADIAAADLTPLFEGADAVIHLAWLIQPGRDEEVLRRVNVDGSLRVFNAAAEAGVGALVHASSIGTYAPGPKRPVDESWPATGIPSSIYSRHKAACERALDELEAEHPELRIVRLRPALIFQREAATEIRRYFVGPFLPNRLVDRRLLPVVPAVPRLAVQAVHADDVAEAYRLALAAADVRGAFNIAADPVLDPPELARILGARQLHVPARVLRTLADVTFKLHLQPTEPGWLDMGLAVPLMDTTRARTELGWTPQRTAEEALLELMEGLRQGAAGDTPVMSRAAGGPARVRELLTGVGRRN